MHKWRVKLDKRGRFTVPKSMRDECGIHPGDDFDFGVKDGRAFMVRRADGLAFNLIVIPDSHP